MTYTLPTIDWPTILPVVVVAATGVVALIVEMLVPRRNNNAVIAVSLVGLAVAAYYAVSLMGATPNRTFAGMVVRDQVGTVLQIFLIGVCAVSFLFSEKYLREKAIAFAEFYPLVLWSTAGAMVMVSTTNLLMIFLGLEVLSIALYCLAGMSRKEQRSEESALKYFLLGAFASAFFLYGVALLYGVMGSVDLALFAPALALGVQQYVALAVLGTVFVIIGLGFKSALVPFHQWTPDVYQGAPTNVTAFMAAASKIAAFGALYRVLASTSAIQANWLPVLTWMAILTMVVGNVYAIAQRDVKRILGYSSVAHAGYVLVALLAHVKSPEAVSLNAVVFYLFAYSLMTVGSFAIITLCAKGGKESTKLQDLNGLWQRSPFAALCLMVFMFSLVGIPPTAGFFGKYMIFVGAISADLQPLAYVLAASSAVSVYYYLAIVRASWVEEEGVSTPTSQKLSPMLALTCAICLAGVVGAMVFAKPVMDAIDVPNELLIESSPAVPLEQPGTYAALPVSEPE